jgi:predicted nicotinamide N-methyase
VYPIRNFHPLLWYRSKKVFSLAAWSMTAAVLVFRSCRARSAAAGIAKFFGRRAFVPVTVAARAVAVPLSAYAGMQREIFVIFLGVV